MKKEKKSYNKVKKWVYKVEVSNGWVIFGMVICFIWGLIIGGL